MNTRDTIPCRLHGRPAAKRLPASLLATLLVLGSEPAPAQTCAAPAAYTESDDYIEWGDTAMGENLPMICGSIATTGPSYVYLLTLPVATDFTISVSSEDAGFSPVVLLADGTDACAQTCLAAGAPGFPLAGAGIPPGTHWLIVTSDPSGPPGTQGAFMLQITGLMSDVIFRNGFDQAGRPSG